MAFGGGVLLSADHLSSGPAAGPRRPGGLDQHRLDVGAGVAGAAVLALAGADVVPAHQQASFAWRASALASQAQGDFVAEPRSRSSSGCQRPAFSAISVIRPAVRQQQRRRAPWTSPLPRPGPGPGPQGGVPVDHRSSLRATEPDAGRFQSAARSARCITVFIRYLVRSPHQSTSGVCEPAAELPAAVQWFCAAPCTATRPLIEVLGQRVIHRLRSRPTPSPRSSRPPAGRPSRKTSGTRRSAAPTLTRGPDRDLDHVFVHVDPGDALMYSHFPGLRRGIRRTGADQSVQDTRAPARRRGLPAMAGHRRLPTHGRATQWLMISIGGWGPLTPKHPRVLQPGQPQPPPSSPQHRRAASPNEPMRLCGGRNPLWRSLLAA